MMNRSKEMLVGLLVIASIALVFAFAGLLGISTPFSNDTRYEVLYAFAGGVEVGSPVRVAGVKVGRVERIEFLPEATAPSDGTAAVKLTLSVSPRAAQVVRKDSKFYVNMAGIIGERYVEISPGSTQESILANHAVVRGIDPPRLDQLLSQGYGVFGRIDEFLEKNDATLSEFLTNLGGLLGDANNLLKSGDKRKVFQLVENLTEITGEMKSIVRGMKDPKTKAMFEQLSEMIERAHQVDRAALKKFLQEEGVRARIF